jgi:Skp family chaperone for outer membrane proteins
MTFLSGSALAQTKIATVNLRKLFDGYWKTKEAQADIQEQKAQLDKDDNALRDGYKKISDEYQQLVARANDQVISADERARRQQAAADKLKQLQESNAQIDSYEHEAQTRLSDQLQRTRDKVLADIKEHIDAAAKAGGYSLVLDTDAKSATATDIVLYHDVENDLTDAVLKQLNAGSPIDTTAPAMTTPAPSLLDTNSP